MGAKWWKLQRLWNGYVGFFEVFRFRSPKRQNKLGSRGTLLKIALNYQISHFQKRKYVIDIFNSENLSHSLYFPWIASDSRLARLSVTIGSGEGGDKI